MGLVQLKGSLVTRQRLGAATHGGENGAESTPGLYVALHDSINAVDGQRITVCLGALVVLL